VSSVVLMTKVGLQFIKRVILIQGDLSTVKGSGTFNGEVKFGDIDRDHHKVQTGTPDCH